MSTECVAPVMSSMTELTSATAAGQREEMGSLVEGSKNASVDSVYRGRGLVHCNGSKTALAARICP